jgi:SAM-dependent methyltransferase
MAALLSAFVWPSEAFWRYFELRVMQNQPLLSPVLELGCGTGSFSELAGLYIDEAIDLSGRAVEIARTRAAVYGRVRRLDMRDLAASREPRFRTIFANSVLEHVKSVETVLKACTDLLVPGGQLVATVPLAAMNDHLFVKSRMYADWRQRQLRHYNLWSEEEWTRALGSAGFQTVTHHGYLAPENCRFWDALDVLGTLGVGKVHMGSVIRRGFWPAVPRRWRARVAESMADRLEARLGLAEPASTNTCATLIVATTPISPAADATARTS